MRDARQACPPRRLVPRDRDRPPSWPSHRARPALSALLAASLVLTSLSGLALPRHEAGASDEEGTLIVEEDFGEPDEVDEAWSIDLREDDHPDEDREPYTGGRLRLTETKTNQAGTAVYDRAQPTSAGLDVTFRMRQHGGSTHNDREGDGLSFFLIDGETEAIRPGSSGGRLGYVNLQGEGGSGALLGVGFDRYGNFATEQTSGCHPSYGARIDALTLRGGPDDDWCVLHEPKVDMGWQDETHEIRVEVDPSHDDDPEVEVFKVGEEDPLVSFAQPDALQEADSFKLGFSASTGSATNNHDIWDLTVRSLEALAEPDWGHGEDDEPEQVTATYEDDEFSLDLSVGDNAVAPVSFDVVEGKGALPKGVEIENEAQRLAGTPEETCWFAFTIRAEDSRGVTADDAWTAERAFDLWVAPAIEELALDADPTSITAEAEVTTNDLDAITERGFLAQAGDTGDPELGDEGVTSVQVSDDAALDAPFEATLEELDPATEYRVRAYARAEHTIDGTTHTHTAYSATKTEPTLEQPLSLHDVEAADRAYDGTDAAEIIDWALEGVLAHLGDVDLADTVAATFAQAAPGEGLAVTIDEAELHGDDAERYALDLGEHSHATPAITRATASLRFHEGLTWEAFEDGEEASRAPVVTVDPRTDAVDGTDALADAVELDYGPDGDPTTPQPSAPGTYRVVAELAHPHYTAPALPSTVVVLPASDPEDDDAPPATIGPVSDDDGSPRGAPTDDVGGTPTHDDGEPVEGVTTERVEGEPLSVIDDDYRLSLSASDRADDDPSAATGVDAERRLRVTAGRYLRAEGSGFDLDTAAEVWLFSEPVLLGTAAIDQDGRFEATLEVPEGLEPGEHTVQLNGRYQGSVRSTSLRVHVDPAPRPPSRRPAPEPDPDPALRRHGGAHRVATAATIAVDAFGEGTDHAVLATCDVPADALAATPLAAAHDAPILLTCAGDDEEVEDEVTEALADLEASEVTVVGGPSAVPASVVDALAASDRAVSRVAGPDRYVTAVEVAGELVGHGGEADAALLATSDPSQPAGGWPDALSAGAYAAVGEPTPILLTAVDALPETTAQALADRQRVELLGGTRVLPTSVAASVAAQGPQVSRLDGRDRYATNRAVIAAALEAGADPTTTWVATGRDFPDALAAGAAAAHAGGVLLLVDGQTTAPSPDTRAWLDAHAPAALRLAGGSSVLGDALAKALHARE